MGLRLMHLDFCFGTQASEDGMRTRLDRDVTWLVVARALKHRDRAIDKDWLQDHLHQRHVAVAL